VTKGYVPFLESGFSWINSYSQLGRIAAYTSLEDAKRNFVSLFRNGMYVCIRGGLLQPLHLDPQWSIVLNPYDR
jgi:hypothetical protein